MKYSIGIKSMPEYGLSNGEMVHKPESRDWFNGLEEVLLYMDDNIDMINTDLDRLRLENATLSILKAED